MKQNSSSSGIDRRAVLSTLAVLPALSGTFLPTTTRAATGAADGGFSFAACGDTRPMMYLPQNADKPDLTKLFVEMFGLGTTLTSIVPSKQAFQLSARIGGGPTIQSAVIITGKPLAFSTSRRISLLLAQHYCPPTGFAGDGLLSMNPIEHALP